MEHPSTLDQNASFSTSVEESVVEVFEGSERENDMPSPSELQEMLQRARERFDAAVEDVEDATLETQAVCGVWSARDVAGHLTDWNGELLGAAEYGAGILAEPGPLIEDGEQYNTDHAAARATQPWLETKADLDASMERASALLASIGEADLAKAAPYPWGGEGTVGELIADVAGHVDEHVVDLENNLPG